MMQAIRIDTTINSALAALLPDLHKLEGQRVELIVLAPNDVDQSNDHRIENKITFEQFLATRPVWPKDHLPVTLEDMEEAIIQGAIDSANL